VMPIERFARPEHLVSYAGLAPRTRQSGLKPIRHGHIPAGANRWLPEPQNVRLARHRTRRPKPTRRERHHLHAADLRPPPRLATSNPPRGGSGRATPG
jgi:transposase